jgi:hypothetical protein
LEWIASEDDKSFKRVPDNTATLETDADDPTICQQPIESTVQVSSQVADPQYLQMDYNIGTTGDAIQKIESHGAKITPW